MSLFFSQSTVGFYDDDIHGAGIPEDAVEITRQEHAALMAGQSAGRIIAAGVDGRPVLLDPPPFVPVVPQTVTMRQARLSLLAAGLLASANQAIAQAGDAAQIEWEYAQTVDRQSDLVQAMAAALSLSSAQLDELFTQAAAF